MSPRPAAAPRPHAPLRRILGLGVVLLAALPFLRALGHPFVDWDDELLFVDNPGYRGLSLAHLGWMLSSVHMGLYMPVTWLSSALDHALWGLDPRGYHLGNLLLHAGTAGLLFLAIERLLDLAKVGGARARLGGAAFGALVFALHPLRVESVAWATERRDVLSGLFLMAALLAYLRHVEWPGGRALAWSGGLFALALLAKPAGMTFPLVLLALDVWPLGRLRARGLRALLAEKGTLLALGLLGAWIGWIGQARTPGALTSLADLGWGARVDLALRGFLFYPWKTIAPSGLAPLYPLDPSRGLADAMGPASLLAGLAGALLAWRRRVPGLVAAVLAYGLLIAPLLGLAHAGRQEAADRYSYLATLPFAFLAAGLLARSGWRADGRARGTVLAAAGALLLLGGGLAARQTEVWRDSVTLWRRVASVTPGSAVGHHRLGVALLRADRAEEAEPILARAATLGAGPGEPDPRYDLARCRLLLGDEPGARAALDALLAAEPDHLGALLLAEALDLRAGALEAALARHRRALAVRPELVPVERRLARLEEAQRSGAPLTTREFDYAAAQLATARELLAEGRPCEAEYHLRNAAAFAPSSEAWTLLATSLEAQGKAELARAARARAGTGAQG